MYQLGMRWSLVYQLGIRWSLVYVLGMRWSLLTLSAPAGDRHQTSDRPS